MNDYSISKDPTEQEKEFNDTVQKIANEISEVLKKYGEWAMVPSLNISPKGIVPVISLEQKKEKTGEIIIPKIPLIVPK